MKTLLALVLCMAASCIQAVQVDFGELDYQAREGTGGVSIVVQKRKENFGNLVLSVQTVLYTETSRRPGDLELPNPAEYVTGGRQDFVRKTETVTFSPSRTAEDQMVSLEFNDDEINEATEGFLVILSLQDGTEIDTRDADNFEFIRQGVTLIRIVDDDPIQLAFEDSSYTVNETDGAQDELINIIKVDNRLSEQEIDVFIELSPGSGELAAQEGNDFEIVQRKTITLQPDQQNVYVPFVVLDDKISEFTEFFNIFLSIPNGAIPYTLAQPSATNVFIEDNEVARIGFETTSYVVVEGEPSIEVCLNVTDEFEFFVFGNVVIEGDTATEFQDFTFSESMSFFLDSFDPMPCFTINIMDDELIEGNETITVTLVLDEMNDLTLTVEPLIATVTIVDNDAVTTEPPTLQETPLPPVDPCDTCGPNSHCVWISQGSKCEFKSGRKVCTESFDSICVCDDGFTGDGFVCEAVTEPPTVRDPPTPVDPCSQCGPNSQCVDGFSGTCKDGVCVDYLIKQCVCNEGFTGNGIVCEDIDECALGTDNCGNNANCINTVGSFRCECQPGFTGNGLVCRDINECQLGTHDCTRQQTCRNTIGSFQCRQRQPPTTPAPCPSKGFRRVGGSCMNINECAEGTDNCDTNANCEDRIGFFRCTCRRGFTGNGRTCTRKRAQPRPRPSPRPPVQEPECDDSTGGTSRRRSRSSRSKSGCGTPRSSTGRTSTSRGGTTRSSTGRTSTSRGTTRTSRRRG